MRIGNCIASKVNEIIHQIPVFSIVGLFTYTFYNKMIDHVSNFVFVNIPIHLKKKRLDIYANLDYPSHG